MNLIKSFTGAVCIFAAAVIAAAPTPTPEQLLPADTIGFVSVPDWSKQSAAYSASAYGQMLSDPSMKAFTDRFIAGFQKDVVVPLEKELGIKLNDYKELLQGQVTLAVLPGEEKGKFSWMMLLDSKDKQQQLTTRLTEVRKRWSDSGKQVKTEKIRDVEFTTIAFTSEDLKKLVKNAFPQVAEGWEAEEEAEEDEDKEADAKKKTEIVIGQSGSLLLMGDSPKTLEKALSRLSGGLVNPLAEQSAYQKDATHVRNALMVAWVNWKPVYAQIVDSFKPSEDSEEPQMINPQQVIAALGLGDINSLAFSTHYGTDGATVAMNISAPEASRKGLLKMLAPQAMDASPPPTIAADAVKFQRWRLNLPSTWDQLEAAIRTVSPQAAGVMTLVLGSLGKDKDPNFDFRKSLIGNLGDDLITVQKAPRSPTIEALQNPPTLFMIGSPKPDELASALTSLSSMMGPPESGNSPFKEREFLGKKIYSVTAPNQQDPDKTRTLSYASSGGYVVFSTDTAALEEHLRATEKPAKSLRELAGFREAGEKVGGMGSGLFGFENQVEVARSFVETVKKDPKALDQLLSMGGGEDGEGEASPIRNWIDFSLLPNFEQIAKYFTISVYSFSANADGLTMKGYSPQPPQLKK